MKVKGGIAPALCRALYGDGARLAASRGRAAGLALHAGAVADEGEVAALGAGVAGVALLAGDLGGADGGPGADGDGLQHGLELLLVGGSASGGSGGGLGEGQGRARGQAGQVGEAGG